jgi:hypothetical protein
MPERHLGMLLLFISASMSQLLTALISSQKIAGTAYHIRRVLREFREGKRDSRVRLRRGDYQHELARDINDFLEWIEAGGGTEGSGSALEGAAPGALRSQPKPAPNDARLGIPSAPKTKVDAS